MGIIKAGKRQLEISGLHPGIQTSQLCKRQSIDRPKVEKLAPIPDPLRALTPHVTIESRSKAKMKFTIGEFAAEMKAAMAVASASDVAARQAAAATYFRSVLEKCSIDEILTVLKESIPPDANVGEMIVHSSDDLTILYARLPPKFMSAVHDHTIFACIASLVGEEQNTIYSLVEGNKDIPPKVEKEFIIKPGQVAELSPDVIHSIANPSDSPSHSLHVYGGDFRAVMSERTLWTSEELKAMPFSFPGLMKESCIRMNTVGNARGLEATAKAIPALQPLIDSISTPAAPAADGMSQ